MDKISAIYSFLSRYKYPVIIILGLLFVSFGDENSFYNRIRLQYQIMDLRSEIKENTEIYKKDAKTLLDIERNPKNIERIAREEYFMKADDEDVFVLSTDPRNDQANQQKDDTEETEDETAE